MTGKLLLLVGKSTTGKSYSLKGLEEPERVAYLNCESGKQLPFPNKFKTQIITDPKGQLIAKNGILDMIAAHPDKFHTVVIDSLTFLMDMFETKYVKTAVNSQAAWGEFSDFFINLMNQKVPELIKVGVNVVIIAHVSDVLNDKELTMETLVPMKGAIGKKGVEAFFNDVVACKKIALDKLEGIYESPLLNITERERELGYKHVIQTRLTKDTVHERLRSPEDMWTKAETFIDDNLQTVLNRMNEFYGN